MKVKSIIRRICHPEILMLLILVFLLSCNDRSSSTETTKDSTSTMTEDSSMMPTDTSAMMSDTSTVSHQDSLVNQPPPPSNASSEKGLAMVYCPTKMIRNVPSIVNATISKEEFANANQKFADKILKEQGKDIKKENILNDIKGDSIDLYEKMGVEIEFDSDDFKLISKNDSQAKEFNNNKTLDWEWTIKPLHSTQKSIINFKFYYLDPDNKENYILEKTISVVATVDARSYIDKWKDFLLDDAKTTITVILIPLITFLGGFFTGKKRNT